MRPSRFALIVVAALFSRVLPAAPPVGADHFPGRMHALIWRNWPVVDAGKLAGVLGTTAENVQAVALSMGLPPQGPILAEWKIRGYITVLRRNWHLPPSEQLLALPGMSVEDLAYALREDDFLGIKLGPTPDCPPLAWSLPNEAARRKSNGSSRRRSARIFPEFGAGHERRLETLRQLVGRARRRGIDVYLYVNEPRAMPEAFFRGRPALEGVREGGPCRPVQLAAEPGAEREAILDRVARRRFGPEGAPHARRAWTVFSRAFREYPLPVSVLYQSPVQMGPANLLYSAATHYQATMTGISYDDLDGC